MSRSATDAPGAAVIGSSAPKWHRLQQAAAHRQAAQPASGRVCDIGPEAANGLRATFRCRQPSRRQNSSLMFARHVLLCCVLASFVTVLAESESSSDEDFLKSYVIDSSICRAKYTCNSTDDEAEGSFRACSCSDSCGLFGTCCTDKYDAAKHKHLPTSSYVCTTKLLSDVCDQGEGIAVMKGCPQGTTESLNNLCEFPITGSNNQPDSRSTPVTDFITGVTYRNIYCAACWNVQKDHISNWTWEFTCKPIQQLLRPIPENEGNTSSDGNGLSELLAAVNYVRDSCSLTYAQPTNVVGKLHTCLPDMVDSCPAEANASEARACEDGPAAFAYAPLGGVYKNRDCALCRVADGDVLGDLNCEPPTKAPCISFVSQSFTVLLSPASDGCPLAGTPLLDGLLSRATAATAPADLCARVVRCTLDRTLDRSRLARECSFLCPVGEFTPDGGCSVLNSTRTCRFFSSDDEADADAAEAASLQSNASAAAAADRASLFDGNTLVVPINDTLAACFSCSLRTYATFAVSNGGVLRVNDSDGLAEYARPFYVIASDGVAATVCVRDTGAGAWKLLPVTAAAAAAGDCHQLPVELTTALLAVSEACLVVFLVLYATTRRLRRYPGDMVANESCAFLVAFLLFLLRPLAEDGREACTVLAVGIHYFLLAAFAWTALYAAEIVRALSFGVAAATDGDASRKRSQRRVASYLLGWGLPLVVVGSGLLADEFGADFRPAYGPPQCFIGERLGNRVLLMAPLCASVLVGVCVYTYMTIKLAVIARQTRAARGGGAHGEKLVLSVKLLFALGLLWIFAVLPSFVESQALACTFVVLNASQGAFLLVAYACNRALFNSFARRWRRWRLSPSERSRTTGTSLASVG